MFTKSDTKWLKAIIATKEDLKSIKTLINNSEKEVVSALTKLVTKTAATLRNELATKEEFKHLPTKDEFNTKMNELLKEVKTIHKSYDEIEDLKLKVDNIEKIISPRQ